MSTTKHTKLCDLFVYSAAEIKRSGLRCTCGGADRQLAAIHGYKLVYYRDGSGHLCMHKVWTIPGKCIECGATVNESGRTTSKSEGESPAPTKLAS